MSQFGVNSIKTLDSVQKVPKSGIFVRNFFICVFENKTFL